MRALIIIDASVWVSHLVEQDSHHRASRRWLTADLNRRETIVAPGLLLAEVAGAIARSTSNPYLGHRAVEHISLTPGLRLEPNEPQLALLAASLAADLRLLGPDAIYVAQAKHLNIPLVSWDQEQLTRHSGRITVFSPAEG